MAQNTTQVLGSGDTMNKEENRKVALITGITGQVLVPFTLNE